METLNYYKNVKNPVVVSATTSSDWFSMIKESEYSDIILSARNGELDYDEVKLKQIPAVTYNFLYNKYKEDKNIISCTGLIYFDIDDPSFDPRTIDRSKVYALYHSFGGYGWSIICRIDGLTKENFELNYSFLIKELGIESFVDFNAKKASQFNVLSFDPNISVNDKSVVFQALNKENNCTQSVGNLGYQEKKAYTHGLGTLRFDNLDEIEFDGDWTVNWEGYDWVRCWIPIKKKTSGRNNLLLSYTNNLVWLNPHISKERCLEVISAVNRIAFITPVGMDQLQRIINSVFKYKHQGTLKPIIFKKKRKIIFKKKSKLTAEDKREIVLALCNEKKAKDSKQKIYQVIEGWDFNNGKLSIRNVAKFGSINKKTVQKYWNEFKEYVNQLNNEI